jgi:hypothetical protein
MRYLISLVFLFQIFTLSAQSLKKEKMEQLSYLIGEWVGTSTLYDEGGEISKQVPAFEKISYDLNESIIVVELNTPLLKLHTIIYFSEEDGTYYYNVFSEKGGRKLPAIFTDGHLVVQANETTRYIFEQFNEHGFREYGEKLVDGEWLKYFEDVFTNTQ